MGKCYELIVEFVCKLTKTNKKEFDCIFIYRLVDPYLSVYYLVYRNENYKSSVEIMHTEEVDSLIEELKNHELEWHNFEKIGGKTFEEWVEHVCLTVKGLDYTYKEVYETFSSIMRKNWGWSIRSIISWFMASDPLYSNLLFKECEILDEMIYDYIEEKAKEEEKKEEEEE